jgi:signal transduction histidine kinase
MHASLPWQEQRAAGPARLADSRLKRGAVDALLERGAGVREKASGPLNLSRSTALVVLIAGIALSAVVHHFAEQQIVRDASARFENECARIQQALERRLNGYAGLLLGVRGLLRGSIAVSRSEFRDYVASLELPGHYPAVTAMNFAEHVTLGSKASFEHAVRRDTSVDPVGYPGFRVRPPGERPGYHVLVYLEPFESNTGRFGVDISFDRPDAPDASVLADERRDTGEFVSSGRLVPGGADPQLALRGAVYRRNFPIENVEQRRRAFIGTVGMAFSLTKLVGESVRSSVLETVHFRIHNVGRKSSGEALAPASNENLLIDSATLPTPAAGSGKIFARAGVLTRASHVEFGGRVFRIDFDGQLSSFSTRLDQALPVLTFAIGVLISLLLYAVIRSLQRSRSELEKAVQQRTCALHEMNDDLHAEIAARNRLERRISFVGYEQRKKIGQELHDDLGQRLTAVAFLAESLAQDLARTSSPIAHEAFKMGKLLSDAVSQTRLLARGLFPVSSEAGGLIGALEQLAADARATYRIDCRLVCDEPGSVEDTGMAFHLYHRIQSQFQRDEPGPADEMGMAFQLHRIAQEAINNAVKHGRASSVTIRLSCDGTKLRMTVTDNGVGFDEQKALRGEGIGLQIMRHRCKMLELGFGIGRAPGGGTTVCIGGAQAD